MGHMNNFYSLSVQNLNIYYIVSLFFLYSILGWLVESIYMSICNRKLTNRGFIKGPICPIYGGSAILLYFLLYPFKGNYIAVYFIGAVFATLIEFIIAQIMLYFFGEVWWDYNEKPFNYKGVICLESTVVWGFYCVMLFAFLQKGAVYFIDFYTEKIGLAAGEAIVSFLIIYYIFSFARTIRNRNSISAYEKKVDLVQENDEEADISAGRFSRVMRLFRK